MTRRASREFFVVTDLQQPETSAGLYGNLRSGKLSADPHETQPENAFGAGHGGIFFVELPPVGIAQKRGTRTAFPSGCFYAEAFLQQGRQFIRCGRQYLIIDWPETMGLAPRSAATRSAAGTQLLFWVFPGLVEWNPGITDRRSRDDQAS